MCLHKRAKNSKLVPSAKINVNADDLCSRGEHRGSWRHITGDIKEAEKEKQERVKEDIKQQEDRQESQGREESREVVKVKDKERVEGKRKSLKAVYLVIVCLRFLKIPENSADYMTLHIAHTYLRFPHSDEMVNLSSAQYATQVSD